MTWCRSTSPFREPMHPGLDRGFVFCQLETGHEGCHEYEDELIEHHWDDEEFGTATRKRLRLQSGSSRCPDDGWMIVTGSSMRYWWQRAVITIVLLLASSTVKASCYQSDVVRYCCPTACAMKKSSHWYQAQQVFDGCRRGLGCDGKRSINMVCGC